MIKTLALTRYGRLGPSSRVRFLQFLPGLAQHGMQIDVLPLLDDVYLDATYRGAPIDKTAIIHSYAHRTRVLLQQKQYDLIWLEKEVFAWIPAFIENLVLRRTPYVVDLDDAWFLRYETHPRWFVRRLSGAKIDSVMKSAATVVVGNEYLQDRALRAGARRVEVVPSAIDLDRYPPLFQEPPQDTPRPLVVGWVGTPFNVRYLTNLAPVLRQVTADGKVKLHIIGVPVPEELSGVAAQSYDWSESTEVDRLRKFDVGIMPLENTPWEQGKCGYKLLQVMAAGKAVVASPVGANCQIVRDGINGFLAESPEQWLAAIDRLSSDPMLRFRMGREGYGMVAETYSLDKILPRLASILKQAAASHGEYGERPIKLAQ
jgi:glycosyltransferase involved in cell wall biosynthesis